MQSYSHINIWDNQGITLTGYFQKWKTIAGEPYAMLSVFQRTEERAFTNTMHHPTNRLSQCKNCMAAFHWPLTPSKFGFLPCSQTLESGSMRKFSSNEDAITAINAYLTALATFVTNFGSLVVGRWALLESTTAARPCRTVSREGSPPFGGIPMFVIDECSQCSDACDRLLPNGGHS